MKNHERNRAVHRDIGLVSFPKMMLLQRPLVWVVQAQRMTLVPEPFEHLLVSMSLDLLLGAATMVAAVETTTKTYPVLYPCRLHFREM